VRHILLRKYPQLRRNYRDSRNLDLRQLIRKERVLGKLRHEFAKLSASYLWLFFAQGRRNTRFDLKSSFP